MYPQRTPVFVRWGAVLALCGVALAVLGCVGPSEQGMPFLVRTPRDTGPSPSDSYAPGETVAVLLPQSGRFAGAAEAVRAGMVSAQQRDPPDRRPVLRFYDSGSEPAPLLVRQAAAQGAQLVIGPLQKQAVDALAATRALPVPTLALNLASGTQAPPPELYQFALSPEDEAAEVAARAWDKGYRNALMLYPEGSWGSRLARGFRERWAALGGRIDAGEVYDPAASDFSGSIRQLLAPEGTQERVSSDGTFIFLVATAQNAREIWRQLQAAGGTQVPPVFCTSHIYSSQLDAQGMTDLAGLYFVDIPWLIVPSRAATAAGRTSLAQTRGDYVRLYAMGVDAYRIAPRLRWMETHRGAAIEGETGVLRLDSQRRVRRELPLARMTPTGPVLATADSALTQGLAELPSALAPPAHLAASAP
jgi:outer membrane PBP1 activator LpoA protein